MKRRRIFGAVALLVLGYCSLLVYQGEVASQETNRAPIPDLPIETVTKMALNESGVYKNITLDDIFISVKTSSRFKQTRLPVILKTWYQLAKQQTWFFTDIDNFTEPMNEIADGHIVNTNCSGTHSRKSLCCKTSVEFDHFFKSSKKWFCHFDDDNYVNVPQLVKILQKYNHQNNWYLGKRSINRLLHVFDKFKYTGKKDTYNFRFATGGAGYCISSSLALKMMSLTSGGRFISVCENIQLPDDITVGFIIEVILRENLTVLPEFHSHLEQLKLLPVEKFRDQISFSYHIRQNPIQRYFSPITNVVDVPGIDSGIDPTRFLSLHCFLFPNTEYCPR